MKTYGLLGKDIGYSLSPAMHNAAFKELGIEAEYKLFDKSLDELDGFFKELKDGKISGCNVTIPYKEKVLEYVDKKDNLVLAVGSLNTIIRRNDGLVEGTNTDHDGFMNALTGKGEDDLGFDPSGKNVFLFGAGGAAKTIVFSLLGWAPECVRRIVIADIDTKKAEKLAGSAVANQQKGTIISVVEDEGQYEEFISKSDLLINATPCGMKESDKPLFDYRYMHERLSVFDFIYAKKTPLIKEALDRGAKAINGKNMLLNQAVAAFECWFKGEEHVRIVKAMRRALNERLQK